MSEAITPAQLRARKHQGKTTERIVALTAYTTPFAHALDAHVDILLVGDSLSMVLYGMDSTVGVSLDTMILHGRAVTRASRHACVVVDMPAGSYDTPEHALQNATRVMQETQCAAVKLEGGAEMEATIALLTAHHIPVMAHIGLMPQRVTEASGFRVQGRDASAREHILHDAHAVTRAGAFAVVVEAVMEPLARTITAEIPIPVIGIGASPACDGQVLVTEDMAGFNRGKLPRFVKLYATLGEDLAQAAKTYAMEVRSSTFPSAEYYYGEKK